MKIRKLVLAVMAIAVMVAPFAQAQLTWDANGTGAGQSNGAGAWLGVNLWWNGTANQDWVSGSDAIFAGTATAAGAVTLASPTTVNSLTFSPSFTGTYTLGTAGQTITNNNGIKMNASSSLVTIISPITLGGSQTWTNNSGNKLQISSFVSTSLGQTLTFAGTGEFNMPVSTSGITGDGSIIVDGAYINLISGGNQAANSYTGTTTVQNGGEILYYTTGPNIGTGNITLNGGILSGYYNQGFTRPFGAGSGQFQITGGVSGFGVNGANTINFSNVTSVKWGDATFNPSKFVLGGGRSGGTVTFAENIDLNNANRTVTTPGAGILSGAISTSTGTAGLIKEGAGTLTLSGANTYNGDTTISAGTLYVGNNTAGTLGNGSYAANISIATNATLAIWSTVNQTLSGVISGQGSLNKAYGGTLTLSGLNTYSGQTAIVPQSTAGCTVNISSFNSVNGGTPLLASSSLGCPTTVANGTIQLGSGSAQASCTLNYTGSGETTDRILNVVFNGNGVNHSITASGAGLLKFTSALTVAPSGGSGSLVLNGSGTGELVQGLTAMQSSGLSKQGTGTWTLSGKNTYSTPTAISGGKLVGPVGGSCSNSAVVVSAGTLGISITNNTQQWVCKSLTHTAASTLEFAFGGITPSASVAPLQVNGDIAFGVAPTVNCTGSSLPAGTYPLITWTGNLSGLAPTSATLPSGFGLLVVDTANKTLWLTIAGSGSSGSQQPLTWQGPAGNTWGANEAVYTKWKDAALVNTNYQEALVGGITVGDNVVFGATGAGAVTVNTTVSPASMQVNSTANYTFSGSGNISGIGGLTKANSGTLTLSMSNSYSGGTVLSAGTLSIAADNALGTGSVVLGGGTIQSSDATARTLNSPVVLNGSSTVGGTGNLSFTSTGAGAVAVASTITVTNANVNATIAAAMGGVGSITKAGSGTVTLTGTSTYSGGTTVNAGRFVIDGGQISHTVAAVTVGAATMVITNSGKVFSGGAGSTIGTSGSANVVGGSGVTSLWNLGNQKLTVGYNTGSGPISCVINGASEAGSAVMTNVNQIRIGDTWSVGTGANNNSLSLINGASVSSANAITVGYADGQVSNVATNNSITITGGAANSILNAGGGSLIVGQSGYGNNGNTGAALNNRVLISTGGIVTNANLIVGYGTKIQGNSTSTLRADNNVVTVNGGGKLYSIGTCYIGYNTHAEARANSNTALISGVNSLWNLGGATLFVGRATAGVATGNVLMVTAGGVVTNISALTVSANNALSLGAGGLIVAGAVTNSGTFAVGLDGSATPMCGRLTATGNLNVNNATLDVTVGTAATYPCVIASYGTLTGGFAVTNGLSDKYRLEMNYKNLNQIAIVYTAAGTLIQLK